MSETILPNLELQMLVNNKTGGFNYRQRREQDWRENYELYRDKVTINRLTQRQSVNIPLMKTSIKTLLKDVDDMPVIVFQNLDNDKQAEIFQNEYWQYTLDQNLAELQDIVDKKQVMMFGRSFDSWQIIDGKVKFEVEDPEDILVDRYMNPYDIDSSRFLIHTHIFKPLTSLANNPDYDQKEVAKLIQYFESEMGIVKAQDNMNSLQQKNQKMADMGVTDIEDPILGETYVELTIHHVFRDNEEYNGRKLDSQIFVYVEAENQCILLKKPQEELIGVTKKHFWKNHYRYNTWADDLDKQDFWTDGTADIIRTPNKIANAWFSQEIERRTLSNFGMTFYDSAAKENGFMPNTFQPQPFGFYAVPGDPNKILRRVEIPLNDGNLESINFIQTMVQTATGATPGQSGALPPAGTPLGEFQAALSEAKQRSKGMSKFYTPAWEQRGTKFLMLIEAGADKLDAVKIFKKGKNTDNMFQRDIAPKDWMTECGYKVKVWSQDEKDSQDTKVLEKQNAVKQNMPDNPKVDEIYKRKLVEWAGYTPEEINDVMEFEKKKQMIPGMIGAMGTPGGQPGQTPQPTMPAQPVAPTQ